MNHPEKIRNQEGFTMIEAVVVIAMIGILATVGIPGYTAYIPDARLKSAARDLYSNMQLTKIQAVKSNSDFFLEFEPAAGVYRIVDGAGSVQKTVQLSTYGSGVRFGSSAAAAAPGDSSPIAADFVSYADDDANGRKEGLFNARGAGEDGFVYLTNDKHTSYAVGTRVSGALVIRKWDGSNWD